MDREVTLKEFMELRFDGLDEKVGGLDKRLGVVEKFISNEVKHAIKMWRWIAGAVVAIGLTLLIDALRQVFGL